MPTNKKQSKHIPFGESIFYSWNEFSRWQLAVIMIHAVIYFALRFQHRYHQFLLPDEYWTMSGFEFPFVEWLFKYLPTHDFHFPGAYLFLYPVGRWISKDKYILSSPYMVLSCLFYYLFAKVNWYRLSGMSKIKNTIDQRWINVLACILVTYNATLVTYSFELRPYAILGLHALIVLLLTDKILSLDRVNVWLSVCVFFTAIFHNYGLMFFLISMSYCLILRILGATNRSENILKCLWRFKKGIITLTIGILLVFPFMWFYMQAPIYHVLDNGFDVHQWIYPGFRGVTQVVALYYGFKPFRILLLILVAIGIFYFFTQKRWVSIIFPLVWVVGPTFLIYLFDLRTKYWFIQRQFLWVMPFHAVFVACAVYVSIKWINEWRLSLTNNRALFRNST